MADTRHPSLLLIHPDHRVRDAIVAAMADRGYSVAVADRAPATSPPRGTPVPSVVIADHTRLPLDLPGQLLVLVPTREQGAILAAFAAGADDVLAGPFRPTELAARVSILARIADESTRISVGPITIDTAARAVDISGRPVDLTRTEYELLARLATAPGRVFTKQELLDAISATAAPRSTQRSTRPTRRVDTQAARLRRRLGDHRDLLVTVWGVGYRLG